MNGKIEVQYKACRAVLGEQLWHHIITQSNNINPMQSLSAALRHVSGSEVPAYLADLALLEEVCSTVQNNKGSIQTEVKKPSVNPTLQIIELPWKDLTKFLGLYSDMSDIRPTASGERVLIWYNPVLKCVIARPVTDEDILVLKIVVEELSTECIAAQGNLPVGAIDSALQRATTDGLVLTPPSRINRHSTVFLADEPLWKPYLTTSSFTLQWHITQACDLSCKHCYDRSHRKTVPLAQAIRVLNDLRTFCKRKHVTGGVSFTGGNPLLHPSIMSIYGAAVERGFSTAILGNPSPRKQLEKLISIQVPAFFQVSLEGLQEHNDRIRGQGHFERTLAFLDLLRELKISSMVMLTVTEENIDQVLPLTETLRAKTDVFHFNRLSMVGEGAKLKLPDKQRFRNFLQSYLNASLTNPILGMKDNLINILLQDKGLDPFGGCTGYGCGAAFNFVTLLSDGEVHACRKFPSPLGNIHNQTMEEIYDSKQAARYRSGSMACASCTIRPVCGGCLASTHSHGLKIFADRDPFCFMHDHTL